MGRLQWVDGSFLGSQLAIEDGSFVVVFGFVRVLLLNQQCLTVLR